MDLQALRLRDFDRWSGGALFQSLEPRRLLASVANVGGALTIEGDATAMSLTALLKELPVRVTQLARGLPVGGDLEYADEITLGRALEGRRTVGS